MTFLIVNILILYRLHQIGPVAGWMVILLAIVDLFILYILQWCRPKQVSINLKWKIVKLYASVHSHLAFCAVMGCALHEAARYIPGFMLFKNRFVLVSTDSCRLALVSSVKCLYYLSYSNIPIISRSIGRKELLIIQFCWLDLNNIHVMSSPNKEFSGLPLTSSKNLLTNLQVVSMHQDFFIFQNIDAAPQWPSCHRKVADIEFNKLQDAQLCVQD